MEAGVGKFVQVPCRAEGSPPVSIEWSKVDGDNKEARGYELSFTAVRQEDAGYYECRARNGHDKDLVSRIKLSVLGK